MFETHGDSWLSDTTSPSLRLWQGFKTSGGCLFVSWSPFNPILRLLPLGFQVHMVHIEVILHGLLAYTLHVGPNVGRVNTRFVYRKFRHRLRARRDHTTEYPATGAGPCLYTPQSNIHRSTFYVRLSWILLRPLFACILSTAR